MEFTDQDVEIVERIVRTPPDIAIKNSVLYTTRHSISQASIENFLAAVQSWFTINVYYRPVWSVYLCK